jgi:hypothetical protein
MRLYFVMPEPEVSTPLILPKNLDTDMTLSQLYPIPILTTCILKIHHTNYPVSLSLSLSLVAEFEGSALLIPLLQDRNWARPWASCIRLSPWQTVSLRPIKLINSLSDSRTRRSNYANTKPANSFHLPSSQDIFLISILLIKFPATETEGSTPLTQTSSVGHDSEPVLSNFHHHNPSP